MTGLFNELIQESFCQARHGRDLNLIVTAQLLQPVDFGLLQAFRNQFLIIQFLQTLIFPTYQCEKEKEKKWKMFLEKNINFQLPENSVYKKENNALLR